MYIAESMPGGALLLPEAARVGDHLLNQIEAGNPLLATPRDRFEAATIVAETIGSERAMELGLAAFDANSEPFNSAYYDSFAGALIQHHGPQGAVEARELVKHIPKDDTTLTAPLVLTRIAEATKDSDLRREATDYVVAELTQALRDGSGVEKPYVLMGPVSYSALILRLGIVNKQASLIKSVFPGPVPAAHKFELMAEIAKALGQEDGGGSIRGALISAAIELQRGGIAFPATIARYGFKDLLDESEMKDLLGAVHNNGRGRRRLLSNWDTAFGDYLSGISVSNGAEFTEFNKLSSEFDAWDSPLQHARFALKALQARLREGRRQVGKTRVDSYHSAAHMAREITSTLAAAPDLLPEEVLGHGYTFLETSLKSPEARLYGLWRAGVIPHVAEGDFPGPNSPDSQAIFNLRARLPDLSVARIELNAALASSGDWSAFVDSADALTRDPEGLLTYPGAQNPGAEPKQAYLFPYRWNFFKLIETA